MRSRKKHIRLDLFILEKCLCEQHRHRKRIKISPTSTSRFDNLKIYRNAEHLVVQKQQGSPEMMGYSSTPLALLLQIIEFQRRNEKLWENLLLGFPPRFCLIYYDVVEKGHLQLLLSSHMFSSAKCMILFIICQPKVLTGDHKYSFFVCVSC